MVDFDIATYKLYINVPFIKETLYYLCFNIFYTNKIIKYNSAVFVIDDDINIIYYFEWTLNR